MGLREHGRAVVVAITLMVVSWTVAPTARAGEQPISATDQSAAYTVWHWNVAGSALHHGSTTDGLVQAAVHSIRASGADLVSFNELCWQQYLAVQAGLAAVDWSQDASDFSRFMPSLDRQPTVCDGQPFGMALFSRPALGAIDRLYLPDDGTENRRGLLCGELRDAPAVHFCTTHITTRNTPSGVGGEPANEAQLDAVHAHVERYHAAGGTAIVAGDFNAQPHYGRMKVWFTPSPGLGPRSAYRELDDGDRFHCPGYGEWTATGLPGGTPPCGTQPGCAAQEGSGCAKIDLILVPGDRIAGGYSADSLELPTGCSGVDPRAGAYPAGACSDHRAVVGRVTVRTDRGRATWHMEPQLT